MDFRVVQALILVAAEGKRVNLLSNQACTWPGGVTTRELVLGADPRSLQTLVPEHGLAANLPPGKTDSVEESLVPFYLVRGQETPGLPVSDCWIFDLPLVGARYFTYLDALRRFMLAAGSRGQPVHVVDRPNPLGLDRVEGPGLGEGHGSGPGLSEVACLDLPIRYGLSPGELAFYLSRTLDLPEPRVIPWTRESDPWGADFVAPSPNLRDLEAIRLYPATCLLEGLNLSLGRGTERPFGWFGSPGLDVSGLLEDLEPPPGVSFRPRTRIPTVSRRAGEECPGVDLLGLMEVDQPVLGFGVRLLESLGRHLPGGFDWIQTRDGRYWLDVLWGGSELRHRLNSRDDLESLGEADPIPDLVQTCWIHPRRTCPENPG